MRMEINSIFDIIIFIIIYPSESDPRVTKLSKFEI